MAGHDGYRAGQEDARGRDRAHLLHDQADHGCGADDAGGGRQARPRRRSAQIYSVVEGVARLRKRDPQPRRQHGRPIYHQRAQAAHEGDRSRHAHIGAYLWLHDAHDGGRRISPPEGRRFPDAGRARRVHRTACEHSAGILAGRLLELFRLHRCDGLSGAEAVRPDLRRVPAHAAVRTAGHEGHVLLGAARQARALRLLLHAGQGRQARHPGRRGEIDLCRTAQARIRRRRPCLHRAATTCASAA